MVVESSTEPIDITLQTHSQSTAQGAASASVNDEVGRKRLPTSDMILSNSQE